MTEQVQLLKQKFINRRTYLEKGAGYLASIWGCPKEVVKEAKRLAREEIMNTEGQVIIPNQPQSFDQAPIYTGGEDNGESVIKKYQTFKPLTRQEIEELVGADGITVEVARVWDKLQPNGMWCYSIDVRFKNKNFYTTDELKEKIKELFPDQTPYTLPFSPNVSENALVLLLADDHVGAVNTSNLFDTPDFTYRERLRTILMEVQSLANGSTFDHMFVVSLGDQLNGWNSQTTRGGHEVKSLSNKEQFDMYVSARKDFYDRLFSSGVANEYSVLDVDNSNHSGSGFSYMANQVLDTYLELKFPQVVRNSILDSIDGIQYGNHVILMGHGKDEKLQKRPMPATLDAKTDLYLYDYAADKNYTPYKNNITFYKGDLHQLGVQHGKFGRYVNVQSIAGNSDYGEINFGNSRGGALVEIYDKNSYRISSHPIWF